MKPRTTSPRNPRTAPHQRGEAARAPRRATAGGKPLSLKQKATLCQLARKAFDHLDELGLVDAPGASVSARFSAWRAAQQAEAVGIASLTECNNNNYLSIRAHFNGLLGRDDVAFSDHLRTGKVKDHGEETDTHEAREAYLKLIMDELIDHDRRCRPHDDSYDAGIAHRVDGKFITINYVAAIAKSKHGKRIESLTADQLKKILFTVRNRIATREGREERGLGRNKSQRRLQ